jgi:hypothetical protein
MINYNNNYFYYCNIIIIILILIIIIIIRTIYVYKLNLEYFTLKKENDASSLNVTEPKTYIYCEDFYNAMEDYILSFYKQLNAIVITYNKADEIPKLNSVDKYIFVKYLHKEQLDQINADTKNVYLINTEQLTIEEEQKRLNSYPKSVKMLDYSKSNLKYYDKEFSTKLLQYQLNHDEIYNLPKTKTVCMMKPNISSMSSNRQKILDEIKSKGIEVDLLSGWKKDRDIDLFSHKIIINLGYGDKHKIFESLRCDRCLFNKMIIISEKKEDYETYYFNKYIIFEDYDKIVDKIVDVCNNYDKYYKELGLDTLDIKTLKIEPVSL